MASSSAQLEKTANLLREAIPIMSKLNIPLTPENYHVWYEYTLGGNLELNKTIDELLENGTKFTSKVNNHRLKPMGLSNGLKVRIRGG